MRKMAVVWCVLPGLFGWYAADAFTNKLSDAERYRLSRYEFVCRIFSHREPLELRGTPLVDYPHASKSDLLDFFGSPLSARASGWEADGLHWEDRYIEVEFKSGKLAGFEKRDLRDDSRIIFFKELTLSGSRFLLREERIAIGSSRGDIVDALGIESISGGGRVYPVVDKPESSTITYGVEFEEPDWSDINCSATFALNRSKVDSIKWRFTRVQYAPETGDVDSVDNWGIQKRYDAIGYNDNLRADGISKLDQIDLAVTIVNNANDDGIYISDNSVEFHSSGRMTLWKFFRLLKTVLEQKDMINVNLPPYLVERHIEEMQSVPLPLLIENFQRRYPDIRFIEDDFGLTVNQVID